MRRRQVFALMSGAWALLGAASSERVLLGEPGDGLILSVRRSGQPGPLYFSPHDNENGAIRALEALWASEPAGVLLEIRQSGRRYIYQQIGARRVWCDPNRLYGSPETLRRALKMTIALRVCGSTINRVLPAPVALLAVERFSRIGREILGVLIRELADTSGRIIALHNNTAGGYDLGDAAFAQVHREPGQGPDDFFVVTSEADFEALRVGFNVAIEQPARDDGSLSYWARRAGVRYINVEAQHRDCLSYTRSGGHRHQTQMIRVAAQLP